MIWTDVGRYAVATIVTLILGWCALTDVRARIIPNKAVLCLLAVYVVAAVLGLTSPPLQGLAAGALALAAGFALYAFKIVGAGDAKLFAAVALFAGLAKLSTLALATALAGGLLAVGMLAFSPRRGFLLLASRGQLGAGEGIPYGVAIAIGGIMVVWPLLSP
jgi:prepilin peptidase CpaA